MAGAATDFGSIAETTVLLGYFRDLPDPRQVGKVVYVLNAVLLLAVLAGAESFTDIARFGDKKLALLRRVVPNNWPGLKGVIMVESQSETGEKIERETRFYITSKPLQARLSGPMIRDYWSIENTLHWVLDRTFRDDECRIRTEHAPANFTTRRHMAHTIVRKAPGKDSLRLRRKTAAWDDHYLVSLIAA